MPMFTPFHLVFPVHNIVAVHVFYGDILGCPEGRSSPDWADLDFYGHQIVVHLAPDEIGHHKTSIVDGDNVPVCHLGVVLSMPEWETAADKLRVVGIEFIIEPHIRFKGKVGEQAAMLLLDPSGNAMEIKVFVSMASLSTK